KVSSGIGLTQVYNPEHDIGTDARATIMSMLNKLPGASIGIAGSRGAGKSTLLVSICTASPQLRGKSALAVWTSAPVEYDARDFLLHIYGVLCQQILRVRGYPNALSDDDQSKRWDSQQRIAFVCRRAVIALFAAGILFAMLASGFAVLADRSLDQPKSSYSAPPPISAEVTTLRSASTTLMTLSIGSLSLAGFLALLGVLLFGSGLTRGVFTLERPRGGPVPPPINDDLSAACVERLRDIRFQRSYSTGWSGALKLPVGIDL